MSGQNVTITDLPDELLLHLFADLRLSDLLSLAQTCRRLYNVAQEHKMLEKASEAELKKVVQSLKEKYPNKDTLELEELLNIVWSDSFFDTYKQTCLEYIRELDQFKYNLNIPRFVKEEFAQADIRKNLSNSEYFGFLNSHLVALNKKLIKSSHKLRLNSQSHDFSALGLTRLLISDIHEKMGNLMPIFQLMLQQNDIKHLPEILGRHVDLTKLNLASNKLDNLPDFLNKLSSLFRIDLDYNKISKISPKNRKMLDKTLKSTSDIINSQNNWDDIEKYASVLIFNFILPIALYNRFFDAYIAPEQASPNHLTLIIQNILFINMFWNVAKYLHKSIAMSLNADANYSKIPYREDILCHYSDRCPDQIPRNTTGEDAYLIGRESRKGWQPYLQSFVNRKAYSSEFYAGYLDERHNLPSRIEGEQTFKEMARTKLGL